MYHYRTYENPQRTVEDNLQKFLVTGLSKWSQCPEVLNWEVPGVSPSDIILPDLNPSKVDTVRKRGN